MKRVGPGWGGRCGRGRQPRARGSCRRAAAGTSGAPRAGSCTGTRCSSSRPPPRPSPASGCPRGRPASNTEEERWWCGGERVRGRHEASTARGHGQKGKGGGREKQTGPHAQKQHKQREREKEGKRKTTRKRKTTTENRNRIAEKQDLAGVEEEEGGVVLGLAETLLGELEVGVGDHEVPELLPLG
eukprot:2963385-Rhodomonas_salina.1